MTVSGDDAEATRLAAAPCAKSSHDESAGADVTRIANAQLVTSPSGTTESRSEPIGPGSTIKERFVLEELIGHGGMGAVYRARDLRKEEARDRNPHVALKLLNDDFREHPDALIALQREARKSQALAHPNIVTVYDFDREGSTVFLSMELMRGRPLDALIREHGDFGLPAREALQLIEGMARGLAYAHQQGFAHADFKPGNVFVTEDGKAKVLDFGIARAAKVVRDTGNDDETLFDPATLGAITLAYASPEMLRGGAAEPADDIYALACVAYELLTGRHPFLDDEGRKLSADQAAERGVHPQPIRGVPNRVNRAILRGLAFERAARFVDAGEFLDAIKEPVKLRRTILAAIVLLAVTTGASWWITIRNSDILVTLQDLPAQLADSKTLIQQGDQYLQEDQIAEAHKDYSQAWQAAKAQTDLDAGTLSRLRVVVNRRINDVIGRYLQRAKQPELDTFRAEVLRLSLESLLREDLGSRDAELRAALQRLDQRLNTEEQP